MLLSFCGKMGAGKTTYAKNLATELNAILISEDEWLAALYPEEIKTLGDYLKYSSRLKPLLQEHVRQLLHSGISVVMDFPGNTKKQRAWFQEITSGQIPHKMIYLKAEDQLCLQRIAQRREAVPQRSHFDTEQVFYQISSYFQEPSDVEGFHLEIIEQ